MAQNIKNNAWTARYGPNYTNTTEINRLIVQVSKTLEDRAFGGLKIRVTYHGPANETENENGYRAEAYWHVRIQWKSKLQFAESQFWINANTQRIKSDPDPRDYAFFLRGRKIRNAGLYSKPSPAPSSKTS